MNANVIQSARVVELCYETNRAVVRFEGTAPEIGDAVLWGTTQCGWADEFGNLFPLGAWNIKARRWDDADKAGWRPVYMKALKNS